MLREPRRKTGRIQCCRGIRMLVFLPQCSKYKIPLLCTQLDHAFIIVRVESYSKITSVPSIKQQ
jgi:hypothetical protein